MAMVEGRTSAGSVTSTAAFFFQTSILVLVAEGVLHVLDLKHDLVVKGVVGPVIDGYGPSRDEEIVRNNFQGFGLDVELRFPTLTDLDGLMPGDLRHAPCEGEV